MKHFFSPTWVLAAALLPAIAFAADARPRKKAPAPGSGGTAEVLKPFDKNEDHQIDADELAALQRSFAALKKLDANSDGEIEQSEVDRLKSAARPEHRGRGLAGLRQVDKNGNHKVDADEVAALEKLLAGSKIMTRLDQNGNGKLEPAEVERLNERLGKGFGHDRSGGAAATPPATKAPEKPATPPAPAEAPKAEEKKELPVVPPPPVPEAKEGGNFGT